MYVAVEDDWSVEGREQDLWRIVDKAEVGDPH
jgi:hypothetical protein